MSSADCVVCGQGVARYTKREDKGALKRLESVSKRPLMGLHVGSVEGTCTPKVCRTMAFRAISWCFGL